jgi:hypothetical protein
MNLPVCTAPAVQNSPTIAADGAGGAIVAWSDKRSGGAAADIHVQHVLASGDVDPAWPADGRALCAADSTQKAPLIVADGAGGAIVAWEDGRNADFDIFAQHVLASGDVDAAWPADGRALCTAAGDQLTRGLIADGAGGAIVAWTGIPGGTPNHIYAQHVLASGAVDPAWPAALITASYSQSNPTMVADGAGGAIIAWNDSRTNYANIYAQHVLASGVLDPAWPVDGLAPCPIAQHYQSYPAIASDGVGGAIITWLEDRNEIYKDIYAQHVLASGAADPAWPVDGRALCTARYFQEALRIVPDGAGGAIVTWQDKRNTDYSNDYNAYDVYAQHVLTSGAVDPAWPVNGRALCTAAGDQKSPEIVPDGAGGAIVTWLDMRSGQGASYDPYTQDLYAQHVLASGVVDPAWPADGRALCTATGNQKNPEIVTDGAGGAIVAWEDFRGGMDSDIYAQRVTAHGELGDVSPSVGIAEVADTPSDQGGWVRIRFPRSPLEAPFACPPILSYGIWERIDGTMALATGGAQVAAAAGELRPSPDGGWAAIGSRIKVQPEDALAGAFPPGVWEVVGTVPAIQSPDYMVRVPSAGDSSARGVQWSVFVVTAHTATASAWFAGPPDSGYSVDNLAPLVPSPFVAVASTGGVQLHWGANREADLAGYRIYRGPSPGFVPSGVNLVTAQRDTGYFDTAGGTGSYYKLSAVDIHGNQSPFAVASPEGPTSTLVSLASVEVAPDRVRLVWQAPAYPGQMWTLSRKQAAQGWMALAEQLADQSGRAVFEDTQVEPGHEYTYRAGAMINGGEILSPEVSVTIPQLSLALQGVRPNPTRGDRLSVEFVLAQAGTARIELLDVTGRRVIEREVGHLGVGAHSVDLGEGRKLPEGLYIIRLSQGGRSLTAKVAVIR